MYGFSVGPEDGYYQYMLDEWAYLCMNFSVPLWVRGATHIKYAEKTPLPDLPVVMIQPRGDNLRPTTVQGEIDLRTFTHPTECIYWFGGNNEIVDYEAPNTIAKVYIDTPEMMMAHSAGAMVLWDRYVKTYG